MPSFFGGLTRKSKAKVIDSTVILPEVILGIHVVSEVVVAGLGVFVGGTEGAGELSVTPGTPTLASELDGSVDCAGGFTVIPGTPTFLFEDEELIDWAGPETNEEVGVKTGEESPEELETLGTGPCEVDNPVDIPLVAV